MVCALNFPTLEEIHALQLARLDITLSSADSALYSSQAMFSFFLDFSFSFFLSDHRQKRLGANINLQTHFSEESPKFLGLIGRCLDGA